MIKRVVTEISSKYSDYLTGVVGRNFKDKLPFNELFGKSTLRLVQPLNEGNEYTIKIKDLAGYEFSFDWDAWVGFKLSDDLKKNPMKIGKILNKLKSDLTKKITTKESELKEQVPDISPQKIEELLDVFHRKIDKIDELLKVSNLQKQASTINSSLYIVYSRAPIDIIRMSDFDGMGSCHSTEGSYFNCAVADAALMGGVAYLIPECDYKKIVESDEDLLNSDELFDDDDRSISTGIYPLARVRLRLVTDSNGYQLCVPQTKIYASTEYRFNDHFKNQVKEWAKTQDVSEFDFDSLITLQGGSYEDDSVSIDKVISELWGKDVDYETESGEHHHEFHNDEEIVENAMDEFNGDSDSYIERLVGDIPIYSKLSCDFDLHSSFFNIRYRIPQTTLEYVPKGGVFSIINLLQMSKELKEGKFFNDNSIRVLNGEVLIRMQLPSLYEFIEDDAIDLDDYFEKIDLLFNEMTVNMLGGYISHEDESYKWMDLQSRIIKFICKELDVEYKLDVENACLEQALEELVGDYGEVRVALPDLQLDLNNKSWPTTNVDIKNPEYFSTLYNKSIDYIRYFIKSYYNEAFSNFIVDNKVLKFSLYIPNNKIPHGMSIYSNTYYTDDSSEIHIPIQNTHGISNSLDVPYLNLEIMFNEKAAGNLISNIDPEMHKSFDKFFSDFYETEEHLKYLENFMPISEYVSSDELKLNGQMEFNFDESVFYYKLLSSLI